MLENVTIEALYHGNCDQADAKRASKAIMNALNANHIHGLPKEKYPYAPVTKVPLSKKNEVVVVPTKDKNDRNTAVEVYFQVGPDNIGERVLIDLLAQIMYEPLYDQVRTKDQFGYSVFVGARWGYGVMGLYFKVVTASKTLVSIFFLVYRLLSYSHNK